MSPRLSDLLPPPKPRRTPPRTVKGQDIELLESDGQRVRWETPPPPPSKHQPDLVETTKGMDKPLSWFAQQWKQRGKKR